VVNVLVDTNILVDLLRSYQPSLEWKETLGDSIIGISSIVWLEVIQGAQDKRSRNTASTFLSQFEVVYITEADQKWAMKQVFQYKLSHNVDLTDALIAAPAHRLQLPLYTRNTKHFLPLLGDGVQQPY